MPILWTFENQEKLKPFIELLAENGIEYELFAKGKKEPSADGLILSVDDYDFKRAKKLLLNHRKRISNRHRK